jgi:hypothetical protein
MFKAILMNFHIIPTDKDTPSMKQLRSKLGINHEAKDYGQVKHNKKFDFLTVLKRLWNNSDILRDVAPDNDNIQQWVKSIQSNLPEAEARIDKAKGLKENPKPPLGVIDENIKICQQLMLRIALSKNRFIRKYLSIDEEIEKFVIQDFSIMPEGQELESQFAILCVGWFIIYLFSYYLTPHSQFSRYPDNDQIYDQTHSLIKRFTKIEKLLRDTLEYCC